MTRHLTVVPVVDYEPSPTACSSRIGTCRPTAIHRERKRPTRRAAPPVPRDDRSAVPAAAAFAEVALRGVLEVIDGRRPLAQLRPLLAAGLLDTVVALARGTPAARGEASRPASRPAVLRQVRLRIVDRHGEAAEVFATYTRGERVRALAGRVERSIIRGAKRWNLVALQMG
jgi:hypothetical protein